MRRGTRSHSGGCWKQRGGRLGQFPVINFQYRIMMAIPSLIGRLAVANRSFEASGIDAITDGMNSDTRKDDAEFIALFDQQLADEVQHVRFANVWIKKLVGEEGPRTMMALARGDRAGRQGLQANRRRQTICSLSGVRKTFAARLGFTEDEIQIAHSFARPLVT